MAPKWKDDPMVIDWDALGRLNLLGVAGMGLSNANTMGIPAATAEAWVREYLVKWGVESLFRKLLVVWPYDESDIATEIQHLEDRRGPPPDDVQWPFNPLSLQRWNDAAAQYKPARQKLAAAYMAQDNPPTGSKEAGAELGVGIVTPPTMPAPPTSGGGAVVVPPPGGMPGVGWLLALAGAWLVWRR